MPFDFAEAQLVAAMSPEERWRLGYPPEPVQLELDIGGFSRRYPPKPTLENLAIILRDKKQWPKGFRWSYRDENTCAIGLVNRIWCDRNAADSPEDNAVFMARLFGLDYKIVEFLFYDQGRASAATIAELIEQFVFFHKLLGLLPKDEN